MARQVWPGIVLCSLLLFSPLAQLAWGDEAVPPFAPATPQKALSKDPPGMKRLLPDSNLWIDAKNKRIVFDGVVCLRQGPLEMLVCAKGTKEHESVIAADTKASAIHAGLLAVGAKAGTPVQFQPEYRPATGSEIDVTLIWEDDKKTVHRERAQEWVRNVKTQKAMEFPWVFAGSIILRDQESGTQQYLADQGDIICVSNFASAMLDLPVPSSQSNAELMFNAFTEHIPPVGTPVRVVLSARPEKRAAEAKPTK